VHWHGQDTVVRLVQDLFAASTTEAAPVLLRLKSGQGSRSQPFNHGSRSAGANTKAKTLDFFGYRSLIFTTQAAGYSTGQPPGRLKVNFGGRSCFTATLLYRINEREISLDAKERFA
jgi:hypothetical protein